MQRTIPAALAALLLLAAPVAASAMDAMSPAPHASGAMKHAAAKKHDTMKKTSAKHASGTMKHATTMRHAPSPKPSP